MNYNKLWSLINKDKLSKSAAARIAGMTHQGFTYMMERKTMTVEALEKFSSHFKVPVANFFEYEDENLVFEAQDAISEVYGCKGCSDKVQTIETQKKLINTQESYILSLEEQLGKKQKHG